jgi:peptidyl-tRNA hydrolase
VRPVQYIILNKTLGMSTGKAAAQAAHAAVEGVRKTAKEPWGNPWDTSIVNNWYQGGHYAKVVLETDDIATAATYIQDRGFKCAVIIDEGRTEFSADLTPTAIGVEVLDKDNPHVAATFSAFKLYSAGPEILVLPRNLKPEDVEKIKEMARDGKAAAQIKEWLYTPSVKFGRSKRRWRFRND